MRPRCKLMCFLQTFYWTDNNSSIFIRQISNWPALRLHIKCKRGFRMFHWQRCRTEDFKNTASRFALWNKCYTVQSSAGDSSIEPHFVSATTCMKLIVWISRRDIATLSTVQVQSIVPCTSNVLLVPCILATYFRGEEVLHLVRVNVCKRVYERFRIKHI